ncbi:hypothetical protein GCM10025880_54460 [Methylorubrum aminovorans]|nr:hypothetical protein GCM10025880_54460 [Methylorubrum aminovorans]
MAIEAVVTTMAESSSTAATTKRSPSGPAARPSISGSSRAASKVVRMPMPEIGLEEEPSSPAR